MTQDVFDMFLVAKKNSKGNQKKRISAQQKQEKHKLQPHPAKASGSISASFRTNRFLCIEAISSTIGPSRRKNHQVFVCENSSELALGPHFFLGRKDLIKPTDTSDAWSKTLGFDFRFQSYICSFFCPWLLVQSGNDILLGILTLIMAGPPKLLWHPTSDCHCARPTGIESDFGGAPCIDTFLER